jgi:hypothetical protein
MTNVKKAIVFGTVGLLALVAVLAIVLTVAFRHKIANHIALANGRSAIARHAVATVDMDASYTVPAAVFGNEKSYWSAVPNGFQVFDHVPLQIDGLICLWGDGNAKAGAVFPEQVLDIPVKQKFETLYVYHGAFFSAPDGTPVCEIVFRYEDGSSATNQLLYGSDMLDFVIDHSGHPEGPTGAHSKRVWTGATFAAGRNEPLQFNLTKIENPQSYLEVTTIDLYSCKSRSAACILAMTTGKSGLMK